MNVFTKIISVLAIIAIVTTIYLFTFSTVSNGGILLALAILLLGLSVQKLPGMAGSFYTFIILSCVVAGFAKPGWFETITPAWFGLSGEPFKTTKLITPLLQVIMFGMGTQLTIRDFQAVVLQPKGVVIGLILQFLIMPISGCGLAFLCRHLSQQYGFGPEILAGIILVGCSPSGVASNVMSFLAKANVALSVTLSACATLAAPVLTPLFMKIFASQYIEIHFLQMMSSMICIVIFPIIAGLLFKVVQVHGLNWKALCPQAPIYTAIIMMLYILYGLCGLYPMNVALIYGMWMCVYCIAIPILASMVLRPILNGHEKRVESGLALISSLAVGLIILVTVVSGRDSLIKVGLLLLLVCLTHNLIGYYLGYLCSKLFRLPQRDCRTISIEVGIQNSGLATSIASELGKVATLGLAPTVFGCIMNTTGSILATIWRRIPCTDDK